QICRDYAVQCIDLFSLSQVNLQTIDTFLTPDRLHPNVDYMTVLGQVIGEAFITRNNKGVDFDPKTVINGGQFLRADVQTTKYGGGLIINDDLGFNIGTSSEFNLRRHSASSTLRLKLTEDLRIDNSGFSQRYLFDISEGSFTATGTVTAAAAEFTGTVQAGGYESSDGTSGITTTFNPNSITSITVKNGLITAVS